MSEDAEALLLEIATCGGVPHFNDEDKFRVGFWKDFLTAEQMGRVRANQAPLVETLRRWLAEGVAPFGDLIDQAMHAGLPRPGGSVPLLNGKATMISRRCYAMDMNDLVLRCADARDVVTLRLCRQAWRNLNGGLDEH